VEWEVACLGGTTREVACLGCTTREEACLGGKTRKIAEIANPFLKKSKNRLKCTTNAANCYFCLVFAALVGGQLPETIS
jgi:hypothetical protein